MNLKTPYLIKGLLRLNWKLVTNYNYIGYRYYAVT